MGTLNEQDVSPELVESVLLEPEFKAMAMIVHLSQILQDVDITIDPGLTAVAQAVNNPSVTLPLIDVLNAKGYDAAVIEAAAYKLRGITPEHEEFQA